MITGPRPKSRCFSIHLANSYVSACGVALRTVTATNRKKIVRRKTLTNGRKNTRGLIFIKISKGRLCITSKKKNGAGEKKKFKRRVGGPNHENLT